MIKIKKATKKEADKFAKEEWKKFNKEKNYNWKEEEFHFLAYENAKPVGYICFEFNGGAAYLGQFIILRDSRNKGIGNKLLKKFEKTAKEKKCHLAYLETSEKNYEAIQFYKKNNYKITAEFPNNKFHLTWYILEKRFE